MRTSNSQNAIIVTRSTPNDSDKLLYLLEVFLDSIPIMIIATAGHVDHGKTSLVRALTGTNTDRLPEEKKRGLTIDIGFAYLKVSSGENLAFIDVPGHEKFVRNMIAGVGLVDIAVLVVAADDGPMPQTLEHLAILQLMNVRNIVAVISKVDLVASDRVTEVAELVGDLLRTAGFANSKLFCLATNDQVEVTRLKDYIVKLAAAQLPRAKQGHFRMAIDRSFILEGSGTVVTGTVVSGEIAKGESVSLVSDGANHAKAARVRSLHAQNTDAERAYTGQRCALNLSGELTRSMLRRGDWLVTNTDAQCVKFIDVMLTPALFVDRIQGDKQSSKGVSTRPTRLRHWTPAHLHLGTADIPCRIALLNARELESGEYGLARIICDRALSAVHGDRFVLRDQSARKTIAGGRVLDPYPPKRGRSRPERLQELTALDAASPDAVLKELIDLSPSGVSLNRFALMLGLTSVELIALTDRLSLVNINFGGGCWGMTTLQSTRLQVRIIEALVQFHSTNPDALGADAPQIAKLCGLKIPLGVLEHHLKLLILREQVARSAAVYRHSDHEVTLSSNDQKKWETVSECMQTGFSKGLLTPPRVVEIAKMLDITPEITYDFLKLCVSHGKLYKVTDNRFFLPQTLTKLAEIAVLLSDNNNLTVASYRDQSGVGRNLVVELLEYFDQCQFTQRIGDRRRTLSAAKDLF